MEVQVISKMEMQKCPICGCLSEWITNVHCQQEHGMSKKELIEKYGKIKNYKINNSGVLTEVMEDDNGI